MNSTELLSIFREEMNDVERPFLWSDTLLFHYMNDAQNMFCRLTEGIEDFSTTSICHISVVPQQDWYPLAKQILKVRAAVDMTTGQEIQLIPMEQAQARGIRFGQRQGRLQSFVTGLEKHALRAWPMPVQPTQVELQVFRLPLAPITDQGDEEFEIDEHHHLALLSWVKHKAYGKEDAETFDRRKSDQFAAVFVDYCAAAAREQRRLRHNSGTVMYAGL